jgi:hypothetical protein
MNPATITPSPTAVPSEKKRLDLDDIDCCFTIKACALLTGDAILCIPCCCFCGGCCGRYSACISKIESKELGKPGTERCGMNCQVQTLAGILMPITLCGCLWGCCGTCTPCVRGIVQCTMGVEKRAEVQPPQQSDTMTRD